MNNSSDDSDETHSDISKVRENNKQYDIAFLHADVLVYEDEKTKEKKSMDQDQQLSADVMYQQLIDRLVETKKSFKVLNGYLNSEKLKEVLVH